VRDNILPVCIAFEVMFLFLVMFDICTNVHFDTVRLPIVDILFWGDLTKPAITVASVERFYLNLVICLQLDIALLVQNSVKV